MAQNKKRLTPDDKQYSEQIVKKPTTIQSDESDSITTVAFSQFSNNEESQSYYNSLNQLFYKELYGRYTDQYGHFIGKMPHGTGSRYNHKNDYTIAEGNQYVGRGPQFKTKFYDTGILFDISSSKVNNGIEPGTFVLEDNSNEVLNKIYIKDDKYGNLYASGSNYQVSQSNTSPSSSDNYVGNIFYQDGLVVLSDTGSYKNNYWDLDNTGYETVGPIMTPQNGAVHGIAFKPDGTKYFMLGRGGGGLHRGVFEYLMSTPWDVSTAIYSGNTINLDLEFNVNQEWNSISVTPDGDKMFLSNKDSKTIKKWDLDIGWDLSSFDDSDYGSLVTLDLDGLENNIQGHFFRDDGLKLYVIGHQNHSAQEYNLSTAFDLTSITSVSQSFNVSASMAVAETEFNGISFKPDGKRMYTVGDDRNMIYEHNLSTAWDVSTATFNTSESLNGHSNPTDIQWKPDGSKIYILDNGTEQVYQYQHSASLYSNLGTNYTASYERKKLIRTWTWTCVVDPSEFNFTMNPTIINSGSFEITEIDDSRKYRPEISGTFKENHYHSMSIVKLPLAKNHIPEKFRKRSFSPYITKIGLMNDKRELLCVAALPIPIKKTRDNRLVFKIQMDF